MGPSNIYKTYSNIDSFYEIEFCEGVRFQWNIQFSDSICKFMKIRSNLR